MIGKLFISPSNQYIVVGGRHVHNRFWVYDAANKWKKRILGTDGLWRQFWFLPGDVLAAVSPHPMRVEYWDLRRGGDCVKVIPPDHVDVLAVSTKVIVFRACFIRNGANDDDDKNPDQNCFIVWPHTEPARSEDDMPRIRSTLERETCAFSPDERTTFLHLSAISAQHLIPSLCAMLATDGARRHRTSRAARPRGSSNHFPCSPSSEFSELCPYLTSRNPTSSSMNHSSTSGSIVGPRRPPALR